MIGNFQPYPLFSLRIVASVGSLLLKSMVSQCKAMGINQVFLEVRASNEKAIGFYQKYGFKKDAIRENYYSGDIPEDALLMSLGL